MPKYKILIATSSFGDYDSAPLAHLRDQGYEVALNPFKRTLKSQEIVQLAQGCMGILAGTEPYTSDIFEQLPALRVISRCGAGLDTVDVQAADKKGIAVFSTPYGPTQSVAELTVGMVMSLIRGVQTSCARMRRGSWKKDMGYLLSELPMGIIGLGRIGKTVAEILKRLGASVSGCDQQPDTVWAAQNGIGLKERDQILKTNRVICLHISYDQKTRHFLDSKAMSMMMPGSFVINTSRGGLVDEGALVQALTSGHLAGAALDVFEQEPYQGPLKDLDNVILTPHIGSYARAGRIKMETEAANNLITALNA